VKNPKSTKIILRSGLAASAALLLSFPQLQAATCNINFGDARQTMRGFGACAIGWQGTLSSANMDMGFSSGAGQIGLDICRIEASPSTTQSDWSSEVSRGAMAKSRGAIVMATPWSPPASMKSNNSTIGGSLNTSQYGAYKNHLVNFVNYASSNGSSLYAISVQNEPDYQVDYTSCDWTANQIRDFVRDQMGTFSATKVIAAESFQGKTPMTDPTLNDSAARANLDIVGMHSYGATIAYYNLAKSNGKEVWMTEHLINDQSIEGILKTAKGMHDWLRIAEANAYNHWYLKREYGPIDANNNRSKRGCVFSQWSRAVEPGYSRVDTTANPTSGIYVTAFKGSGKFVIVAVNNSTSSVYQQFSVSGATLGTMTRWRTSASENMATVTSVAASSSFGITLPANSVTTLTQ